MTVARLPLACTVRQCGRALTRSARAFACSNGHSYDIARSGYVNLLQPQDRRSLNAGDSKPAVEARARLLARGVGRTMLDAYVNRVASLQLPENAFVADLGAGGGDTLGALAQRRAISGIGIDLSTAAADFAAHRFADLTWVVANADRRLPLLDHSIDLVLSLHARRNPAECARVLRSTGHLVIAVPAHDDLTELRAAVLGDVTERDRATGVLEEHADAFKLVDRLVTRERHHLDRASLHDLLRGTYRGERHSTDAKVGALTELDVTLSSEIFVFAR